MGEFPEARRLCFAQCPSILLIDPTVVPILLFYPRLSAGHTWTCWSFTLRYSPVEAVPSVPSPLRIPFYYSLSKSDGWSCSHQLTIIFRIPRVTLFPQCVIFPSVVRSLRLSPVSSYRLYHCIYHSIIRIIRIIAWSGLFYSVLSLAVHIAASKGKIFGYLYLNPFHHDFSSLRRSNHSAKLFK